MNKFITKNLIVISAVVLFSVGNATKVYADCESNYGGGETCIYNKSFRIEKQVRISGDSDWKDKVTGVEEGETVEFKIKIKNVGEVEVDDMKMKDFLPSELYRVGGDDLTEEWDDFEPGETKTFIIKVKVHGSEYDNDNIDKCVVNKAELKYKGKFEGADTATVCYATGEFKELPKTGAESMLVSVLGLVAIVAGLSIKKSSVLAYTSK